MIANLDKLTINSITSIGCTPQQLTVVSGELKEVTVPEPFGTISPYFVVEKYASIMCKNMPLMRLSSLSLKGDAPFLLYQTVLPPLSNQPFTLQVAPNLHLTGLTIYDDSGERVSPDQSQSSIMSLFRIKEAIAWNDSFVKHLLPKDREIYVQFPARLDAILKVTATPVFINKSTGEQLDILKHIKVDTIANFTGEYIDLLKRLNSGVYPDQKVTQYVATMKSGSDIYPGIVKITRNTEVETQLKELASYIEQHAGSAMPAFDYQHMSDALKLALASLQQPYSATGLFENKIYTLFLKNNYYYKVRLNKQRMRVAPERYIDEYTGRIMKYEFGKLDRGIDHLPGPMVIEFNPSAFLLRTRLPQLVRLINRISGSQSIMDLPMPEITIKLYFPGEKEMRDYVLKMNVIDQDVVPHSLYAPLYRAMATNDMLYTVYYLDQVLQRLSFRGRLYPSDRGNLLAELGLDEESYREL